MGEQSPPVWRWLGCGCAVLALAIVLVAVALGAFGVRSARSIFDTDARADEAREILAVRSIPDGYEVELVMRVPLFADLVAIGGDERRLVYVSRVRTDADLATAFGDPARFDEIVRRLGVRIAGDRTTLGRGLHRTGSAEVSWSAVDGPVGLDLDRDVAGFSIFDFDPVRLPGDERIELGIVFLVRCADEAPPDLGVWGGPRLDVESIDADRAAFESLVDSLGFCAR